MHGLLIKVLKCFFTLIIYNLNNFNTKFVKFNLLNHYKYTKLPDLPDFDVYKKVQFPISD